VISWLLIVPRRTRAKRAYAIQSSLKPVLNAITTSALNYTKLLRLDNHPSRSRMYILRNGKHDSRFTLCMVHCTV